MIPRWVLVCLLFFLLIGGPSSAQRAGWPKEFTAKVVAIKDGDTYQVLYQGRVVAIRLAHIDCPEMKQAFGRAAKKEASDICAFKTVRIVSNGRSDRNRRLICEVFVGNTNVNQTLVKKGLAWHFTRYSSSTVYAQLQQEAKQQKRGLWQVAAPVAPWEWRKRRPSAIAH